MAVTSAVKTGYCARYGGIKRALAVGEGAFAVGSFGSDALAGWRMDVEFHRVIKPRATGEEACLGSRLGLFGSPGGAGADILLVGFPVDDGRA